MGNLLYKISTSTTAKKAEDVATAEATYDKTIHNLKQSSRRFGPKPAIVANVRVTSRMDYAQDICKDWYETGYCVFGDGCKFMHVRDESKPAWQVDAEWDLQQKREKEKREEEERLKRFKAEAKEMGYAVDVPKCAICQKSNEASLVKPAECKDTFCESCIMKAFKAKKRCPVCSKTLSGQFNRANS